ncbi:methyl-accepting chemotaxis protein [Thaumasiovibrio subtropicus]|uniref:methyl-accepting chemotaxis protein n=1 Tax=Thaumasiovibrio subtropicus TaxID=1891207 RepID=UPI000B34FB01|nr:methyl-accepting chemotaxis protein [Thaumasiovibrio subtropicus]
MRSISVQWKITLVSGLGLLFAVISQLGIGSYFNRLSEKEISDQSYLTVSTKTEELVRAEAGMQSAMLRGLLEEADFRAQMLAQSVLFLKYNAEKNYTNSAELRGSISELLSRTVADFPSVTGAFVVFEQNGLDGEDSYYVGADYAGSNDSGRFSTRWDRIDGEPVLSIIPEADIQGGDWYQCSIESGEGCFLNPEFTQNDVTSAITVPLRLEGKVIGVMGLVTSLQSLQQAVEEATSSLMGGIGKVAVIDSEGRVIAADKAAMRGKPLSALTPMSNEIMALMGSGKDSLEWTPDGSWLNTFTPVDIGQNRVGIIIQLPQEKVLADAVALDRLMAEERRSAESVQRVAAGVVLVVAMLMSFIAARALVAPILLVMNRLKDIASGEGDLTQRIEVTAKDEIGELATWFNRFLDKLQSTIKKVVDSAEDVDQTAKQASDVAKSAESNSASQFREVDLVATAAEEMTHTASMVVDHTERSATAAVKALASVDQGESVVNTSSESMRQLVEKMESAVPIAHELAKGSENISQILTVIEGVSEQTNLLALNAAIEAARAGEHGRGFAVVADEVRQLAQRTQDSVGQIREVIEIIQSGTSQVVSAIEDGNQAAMTTAEQVQRAVTSLEEIAGSVTEIQGISEEISRAAQEQQAASSEVNLNVSNIRGSSEQILQQAETTTKVSQHLTDLANEQRQLVGQFKV